VLIYNSITVRSQSVICHVELEWGAVRHCGLFGPVFERGRVAPDARHNKTVGEHLNSTFQSVNPCVGVSVHVDPRLDLGLVHIPSFVDPAFVDDLKMSELGNTLTPLMDDKAFRWACSCKV
jgi:hypothetical protein